jgi:16S rRNA (cytidine1402-2'-O)-methyltransferase
MTVAPGVLYVVATPIGNLGDISARALQVLREVDLIAAEDTRHSRRLLQHFGIATPLLSLHEHNESSRIPQLLSHLRQGKSLALISDAGTPLLSDPGFQLLRSLREQGLRAVPIPGPSSLLAALSVAGLPTDRFVFEGFLPAKATARRRRLELLASEERTLAFFESSHRIQASLRDMMEIFGADRGAVLARELTKVFEEVHGATLAELGDWLAAAENRCKGELVILVQGAPPAAAPEPELRRLLTVLLEELPIKRAVAVAVRLTGVNKNRLYDLALELQGQVRVCPAEEG